jgi:RNA polymerase sigma factor (sigma-70 family)
MTLFSLNCLELDPSSEDQPEAEAAELREFVNRELGRLPKHERDALRAYARESGESCRSVARRYGVSPQTASNWVTTARKKLRRRLEGCR